MKHSCCSMSDLQWKKSLGSPLFRFSIIILILSLILFAFDSFFALIRIDLILLSVRSSIRPSKSWNTFPLHKIPISSTSIFCVFFILKNPLFSCFRCAPCISTGIRDLKSISYWNHWAHTEDPCLPSIPDLLEQFRWMHMSLHFIFHMWWLQQEEESGLSSCLHASHKTYMQWKSYRYSVGYQSCTKISK